MFKIDLLTIFVVMALLSGPFLLPILAYWMGNFVSDIKNNSAWQRFHLPWIVLWLEVKWGQMLKEEMSWGRYCALRWQRLRDVIFHSRKRQWQIGFSIWQNNKLVADFPTQESSHNGSHKLSKEGILCNNNDHRCETKILDF